MSSHLKTELLNKATLLLLAIVPFTLLPACFGPEETQPSQAQQAYEFSRTFERIHSDSFLLVERKMVKDALYISLRSNEDLADMEGFQLLQKAREIVNKNNHEYMVRVFFYNPGENPGEDTARICYQWTEEEGIVLNFDRRSMGESYSVEAEESNDEEDADAFSMPEYTILDTVPLLAGGKHGDVLIPTYSPDTSTDILSETALNITRLGGFTSLSLYSTEEAYRANYSASYNNEHPGALENGCLGRYENGQFYPPT